MKHTIITTLVVCLLGTLTVSAEDSVTAQLPEKLENAKGEAVSRDDLKGKVVALYFSAHRCAPCRAFTPSLVKFHKDNREKDFEVVFVSFDDTADQKSKYISETGMEFLTVAGNKSKDHFDLANRHGVSRLPRLIVLAPDGSKITEDGKDEVSGNAAGALEEWKKKVKG